jgi:hypothetical protein
MKTCPYCGEKIQDVAIKCRYCREIIEQPPAVISASRGFLDGPPGAQALNFELPEFWGFEYRSPLDLFGLPLIHIVNGVNPRTNVPRIARGILAIGNIAEGVFAIGGIAVGLFTLGGFGLGVIAIGGMAVGIAALGGISLALWLAMGGVAGSLHIAIGGLALAPYMISSLGVDRELVELLARW